MKLRKIFMQKIIPINLILIMIFSIATIFGINKVEAYTQNKKIGINEFPESYKKYLKELSEAHPNWTFTAFNTGMSFSEFISKEKSVHLRNTIIKTALPELKCSCEKVASGYACASDGAVAYYADPRNFLTEAGVFQFLEMTYNSESQTVEGVESIISGTFMNTEISLNNEVEDTYVVAKIDGDNIISVPNKKISEVLESVEIKSYEVKNQKSEIIENSKNVVTGYKIYDKTTNKTYNLIVLGDVNGDGEIKATDYMKIKNYIMEEIKLDDYQKIAADVNGDGQVKATDYMKIKNYIMDSIEIKLKGEKKTSNNKISYSEIIMKAAEESGISPYSIAIKIIQEVGRNGSSSVSGTYPGYEGYYNFFNYGAYDEGNAIENALKYAKEKGWNNQYTAIIEGSKLMADSYVSVGQNTAYFYKWDVVDDKSNGAFWHQYMTNIQDPSSQAINLFNTYAKNDLLDLGLSFIIPVFENMPERCDMPTSIDKTLNTSYYVNGTGVNLRKGPSTDQETITSLNKNEVVTVLELNVGTTNGISWARIQRANGTVGYMANKYLLKCN